MPLYASQVHPDPYWASHQREGLGIGWPQRSLGTPDPKTVDPDPDHSKLLKYLLTGSGDQPDLLAYLSNLQTGE